MDVADMPDRCGLELVSDRRSGASFCAAEAWESRLSRSPLWSVLERAGLSPFGGRDSRIDDEVTVGGGSRSSSGYNEAHTNNRWN